MSSASNDPDFMILRFTTDAALASAMTRTEATSWALSSAAMGTGVRSASAAILEIGLANGCSKSATGASCAAARSRSCRASSTDAMAPLASMINARPGAASAMAERRSRSRASGAPPTLS